MKRSAEIQRLPIFSLVDGMEIGKVKQLVINPGQGLAQMFLVENEQEAIGIHVLPFASVVGVGDFAVTVETPEAIQEVSTLQGARELVLLGYKIIGTRVMSRKGQLLGTVNEYYVDEESGEVTACSFLETTNQESQLLFDRQNIMTFGRDVIVIKQEDQLFRSFEERAAEAAQAAAVETIADAHAEAAATETTEATEASNVETLAVGPYAYLIGKVLSADLVSDAGEQVAAAGTVVTEELIERVKGVSPTLFMKLNRLATEQA